MEPESDTLTSIVHFSITADRAHLLTVISGVIDSINTKLGDRIGPDSSKIDLPANFEGNLSEQNIELNLATAPGTRLTTVSPGCTNPVTAVLGDIRTLLTILPEAITTALKWTDTISTITCNTAGISSTVHILRSYNVLGDTTYSGLEALVIQRTELTELNGRGAQGQHEVTLTGNGTGLTTLYVDKRGIPLATETSQNLALTIRTSGRFKHFKQHSQQTTKLLN